MLYDDDDDDDDDDDKTTKSWFSHLLVTFCDIQHEMERANSYNPWAWHAVYQSITHVSVTHLQLDGRSSLQPLLTWLSRTERRRCSQRCVGLNELQLLTENLPTQQTQLYETL